MQLPFINLLVSLASVVLIISEAFSHRFTPFRLFLYTLSSIWWCLSNAIAFRLRLFWALWVLLQKIPLYCKYRLNNIYSSGKQLQSSVYYHQSSTQDLKIQKHLANEKKKSDSLIYVSWQIKWHVGRIIRNAEIHSGLCKTHHRDRIILHYIMHMWILSLSEHVGYRLKRWENSLLIGARAAHSNSKWYSSQTDPLKRSWLILPPIGIWCQGPVTTCRLSLPVLNLIRDLNKEVGTGALKNGLCSSPRLWKYLG